MLEALLEHSSLLHKTQEIRNKIHVFEASLLHKPYDRIWSQPIDFFIHSAGLVNLSTEPNVKNQIYEENLNFTKTLYKFYSHNTHKFVYISTAFACGEVSGHINPHFDKTVIGVHRNYYEASKLEAERYLLNQKNKCQIQIIRPSVLGGNIVDSPLSFMSKYMVFYLFAKYFYSLESKEPIRILAADNAGLNIVPTDYTAKAICSILTEDVEQINVVKQKETNIRKGISKILELVGYTSYSFCNEKLHETKAYQNETEKRYYETIGKYLYPYLNSSENTWETDVLEKIAPIPEYDNIEYLSKTVTYAVSKNFKNQKW